MVSLDGYIEGKNKEIDWHNVDEEYNTYAARLLDSADVLLFGKNTYQLMENYWPTREAVLNDPIIAEKMNQLTKIAFSTSLKKAKWQNTRIVSENVTEEILQLKKQSTKDIVILGSTHLVSYLTKMKLIDEFQIMINPIVLGSGTSYFIDVEEKLHLTLVKTKRFASGNVLLCYQT